MDKPRKRISKKVEQLAEQYIELLQKDHFPIDQVFIFGSRVKGGYRKDSDVDIAVVSPKWKDSFSTTRYLLQKAHELPLSDLYIEPHGFHPKHFVDESPIVWEIKTTGIRIK